MNKENRKLKVCFFINGFGEGGAEKQCAYLINELQKDKNISVSLMYFFEGSNFGLVNQNGIDVYKIPSASLYSVKNISLVNKFVQQIQPDILFSWMQAPDVLSYFVKLRFPKIKWIVAERNSKYRSYDFRFILRVVLCRFADAIISNAAEGKAYWLKKKVAERKLAVIPNILYTRKVEKKNPPVITGSPVVLFAGRLEVQKNVLVLAEAFCKLSDKYKNGRFYIVGKGSLKDDVDAIIAKHNKQSQVIVMPFQSNIYDYFNAADAFINISHYEGLPNTVIENISLDKKVIVSKISQHVNILGDDYAYYVNDLDNVDLICAVIEKAIADDDFSAQYISAKKFLESLSPEIIVDAYKQIFYTLKTGTKHINLQKTYSVV